MFIYVLFLSVLHFYNKNVTHTFDNIVLSLAWVHYHFKIKLQIIPFWNFTNLYETL